VADSESAEPILVYSASIGYHYSALQFILRSMREVWSRRPDCRLVVTGVPPSSAFQIVSQLEMDAHIQDGSITLAGYLPRRELWALYSKASALLAPVFDDLDSRARFPTKLAEYMATGRPVITNPVGEIDRFARDGETAFMSPAGDATSCAARILHVLDNIASAEAVGRAGKRTAEENFDYRLHGPRLLTFLAQIAGLPAAREGHVPSCHATHTWEPSDEQ